MGKFRYNSIEQLELSKKKIEVYLKKIDNSVFVFDFGHYIEKDLNNQYYFKSVIFGSETYRNLLFNDGKVKTEPNAYTYFEGNIRQIRNIPVSKELYTYDEETTFKSVTDIITTDIVFRTNNWIEELHRIGINGCLFVFARKVGNYQSGVWLVLKKRIPEIKENLICFEQTDDCNICQLDIEGICLRNNKRYFISKNNLKDTLESIFQELDILLINELVYNAQEYAQKQETERLSERAQKLALEKFRKEILEAHSHTIFNCMPNLKIQNLRSNLSYGIEYFENSNDSDGLKYIQGIDNELKNIHIQLTELNYVTHAALESPVSKKEKLFQAKTLSEIIELLWELTKNRCNPTILGLYKLTVDPTFYDKQCQDVFTVLWNAWNNAVNHSINQSFTLSLVDRENYISLFFINSFSGKINDDHVKLLRSEIDPEAYSAGIPIIKHLCNVLKWETWAEVIDNEFNLEIMIHKNVEV